MPRSILALLLLSLAGCGSGMSEPKTGPFTGTWKLLDENGITQAKEETVAAITADGEKFRIDAKQEGYERLQVYNGELLFLKSKYVAPADMGVDPAAPAGPDDEDEDPSDRAESNQAGAGRVPEKSDLALIRFWRRGFLGKAGAGGKVAGRETTLYQAQSKRPDGDLTVQAWVDSETSVPLKIVETIYSKQVNSMVMRMTKECQEIRYGPVDAASFNKPN